MSERKLRVPKKREIKNKTMKEINEKGKGKKKKTYEQHLWS